MTQTNVRRPARLTVRDVMTAPVVTAPESATFHELAELMQRHAVSAVPIVDLGGRVKGMVSEADLMPKEAAPATPHLWQRRDAREDDVKAAGLTAGDIMTSPVASAKADEVIGVAARRMLDHGVKRLPVLDPHGQIIGIVSRRDVLQAFRRDDDEIRRDIVEGVLPSWMGLDPAAVEVSVAGGVVLLRGGVERRSEMDILVHLVAGLDGVVAVDNQLRYSMDDSGVRPAREMPVS